MDVVLHFIHYSTFLKSEARNNLNMNDSKPLFQYVFNLKKDLTVPQNEH